MMWIIVVGWTIICIVRLEFVGMMIGAGSLLIHTVLGEIRDKMKKE